MLHGFEALLGTGMDRRRLLGGAAVAGGALMLPGRLFAQPVTGFTHAVASGEPGPRSMLFWTRYVDRGGRAVPLRLEVASDPRISRNIVRAEAVADPANDWCAKVSVAGLAPGRTYYYRFTGPSRNRSIVGRTKTLPEGQVDRFRLGVFSCSNLPYGFFNGYGHAVLADDIDLFVHLGDYLYEYGRGTYPDAASAVPGRIIEPAGDTVTLQDYWARYASYRADPDLQALHARVPAICVWDDHEIANDAWTGGAQNHDPRRQGSWDARLAAARKAHRDWLPISDAPYASYEVGRLAALHRLDTRVEGREKQFDLREVIAGGPDVMTALTRFRDTQWVAGNRQLLGVPQEKWLFERMADAARRGVRWQVLAQQVIMGKLLAPPNADQLAAAIKDPQVQAFLGATVMASRLGIPLNMDAWDGYPAARARLLASAQRQGVSLVVLAGDSHNAWANQLENDRRPAGVEFATQSVSSPGFESYLRGVPPQQLAQQMVAANPGLRWAETSQRGYTHVQLTPAAAVAEWRFSAPVTARSPQLASTVRASVRAGSNRLELA
jgi:alkaline phosphatase D